MLYYIQTSRNAIPERGDNMDKHKVISSNLKQLREDRGIKQKFIAEQLGISANYYSQIENGHRPPQVEHLFKLRNIFNTTDRKSTRLNSSHVAISYAVFCLKKK